MIIVTSPCLLKVLIFAVLSLILVQYMYSSIQLRDSNRIDPLFLINASGGSHETLFSSESDDNAKNLSNWIYSQVTPSENEEIEYCPLIPPNLAGVINPKKEALPLDEVAKIVGSGVYPGGQWRPENCRARNKVALVIPYRDRPVHLAVFLLNIHPLLQKQQLDYGIFVIEQAGSSDFNRGMLLNVGFVEALGLREFDCLIFHDVDLLPEDDRNLYTCPDQPRHMSAAVDVFHYRLPYSDIFGGVCAMTREHFEAVNGFSNMFWGWGGEDDDMAARIRAAGLHIARYPIAVARYTMLPHSKQKANPKRFENLYKGKKRLKTDGLNSLQYRRVAVRLSKLFTWVLVELSSPHR